VPDFRFVVPFSFLIWLEGRNYPGRPSVYQWNCRIEDDNGFTDCQTTFAFEDRELAYSTAIEHLEDCHHFPLAASDKPLLSGSKPKEIRA
jgi:hypothetical protein